MVWEYLFLFQEQAVTYLQAEIEKLTRQIENPSDEASEELLKLRTENAKLLYQKTHIERVRHLSCLFGMLVHFNHKLAFYGLF